MSRLPPLSPFFADDVIASQPPEGRKRTIPHKDGIWLTHVYINVDPNSELLNALKAVVNDISCHSLLDESLHISLSREIYLTENQRIPFLNALQDAIDGLDKLEISTESDSFMILSNETTTRHFLCVPVKGAFQNIVEQINGVCREFTQPEYYKDPKYHFSIAWWTESQEIINSLPRLPFQQTWIIDSLECRIGNKKWTLSFDKR